MSLTFKQQEILQHYSPTRKNVNIGITVEEWTEKLKQFNTVYQETNIDSFEPLFQHLIEICQKTFETTYSKENSILYYKNETERFPLHKFAQKRVPTIRFSVYVLKLITEDKECMEHIFNFDNTLYYENETIRDAHIDLIRKFYKIFDDFTTFYLDKNKYNINSHLHESSTFLDHQYHEIVTSHAKFVSQCLLPWYFYNQKYRIMNDIFKRAHISPKEEEEEEEEDHNDNEQEIFHDPDDKNEEETYGGRKNTKFTRKRQRQRTISNKPRKTMLKHHLRPIKTSHKEGCRRTKTSKLRSQRTLTKKMYQTPMRVRKYEKSLEKLRLHHQYYRHKRIGSSSF
jgi:hypothetical protein